ncbi:MAG: hypothetical protein ACFBZ8_10985 [Opitutales bacterium]
MFLKSRYVLFLGWLATGAACFGLGYAISTSGPELADPASVPSAAAASTPGKSTSAGNSSPASASEVYAAEQERLDELRAEVALLEAQTAEQLPFSGYGTFEKYLSAAVQESNDLLRTAMLADILTGLTPEQLPQVLALYESMPDRGWESMRDWNMLMYAWGQFDGPGAVTYARENRQGRRGAYMAGAAVRSWARVDPQAAVAWTQENASDNPRGDFFTNMALISGFAQNDPLGATTYVQGLEPGGERQRLTGVLVNQLLREGYPSATTWARNLDDPQMKTDAYNEIVERWARDDIDAAVRWLEPQLEQPFASDAAAELAGELAETDPASALDLVNKMPTGEARDQALAEALGEWAESDPQAAALWLDEQPQGPETDRAVAAYAREVASLDPVAAMDWANTITDESQRQTAVLETTVSWMRQDAVAAKEWMTESGYSEQEINNVYQRSVQRNGRRRGNR